MSTDVSWCDRAGRYADLYREMLRQTVGLVALLGHDLSCGKRGHFPQKELAMR